MIENRLPWAIGASLLVNAVVWAAVGSAFAYRVVAPPPPIEISRIILHPDGKKVVKVVKPEEVEKKVEKIVREHHLTPPKPKEEPPKPREPEKPQPHRTEPTPPKHTAPPPPQGAHNRVLTSKPTNAAKPRDFTALAGGNAQQGRPTEAQAPGTAATNPASPPKVAPPPAVETKPDSKSTAPPPADPGPKADPKPASPPPPAEPPKAPPPPAEKPKKKGASRDAQHSNEVNPTIPDEVKGQEFKKFVRVKVEIAADGSFTVTLRTSSGNDEVDRRVTDALKKWTWKPKLVDGDPVDSTQLFRFEFEIK